MQSLHLPAELMSKYIVSPALEGDYLYLAWPTWNTDQRKTFLRDYADLFVGLANCGLPACLSNLDMFHQISDTVHD